MVLLAEYYLRSFGTRPGRQNIEGLSPEVARALKLYDWPGNVRELRNVIERAIVLEDGNVISMKSLPPSIFHSPDLKPTRVDHVSFDPQKVLFSLPSDGISLEELETSLMKQALAQCHGNQTRAAKLLGLTRDQFRYRWKKIKEANRPRLVAVAGSHR